MFGHIVHFLRYLRNRDDNSESKLKEILLRLGGEEEIIFILRWMNREMREQNYRIEVCHLVSTAKGTNCC